VSVAEIVADVRERGDAAVREWSLRLDGAEPLTLYAVEARYPTEEPSVGREEANHHLAVGRKVFDEVGALLSLYLDAGRPGG